MLHEAHWCLWSHCPRCLTAGPGGGLRPSSVSLLGYHGKTVPCPRLKRSESGVPDHSPCLEGLRGLTKENSREGVTYIVISTQPAHLWIQAPIKAPLELGCAGVFFCWAALKTADTAGRHHQPGLVGTSPCVLCEMHTEPRDQHSLTQLSPRGHRLKGQAIELCDLPPDSDKTSKWPRDGRLRARGEGTEAWVN